ncbi:MAG: hypothetical protein C0475_02285 [Planctomyces sp.]|nr:hypothetical protein [Planctomyces sp.]
MSPHEGDRFVWPPRPLPIQSASNQAPGAPTPPAGSAAADAGTGQGSQQAGHSVDLSEPTDEPRSWLGQVAQAWLEPERTPFEVWAQRAAWLPDPVTRSCPRCGHTVGPSLHDPEGCHRCRDAPSPVDQVLRLGEYAGALRHWVHRVKFGRDWHAGVSLGRRLGALAVRQLAQRGVEPAWPERVRVVAVPSSWRRRWARAIDHSGAIAQGVARACAAPLVHPIRRRHGPTQVGLSAAERARNVAGKFVPAWPRLGQVTRRLAVRAWPRAQSGVGTVYLLVDDVLTTGATLRAAATALRKAHAASEPGSRKDDAQRIIVWGLIVGVTPDDRGRLS